VLKNNHINIEYYAKNYINFGNKILTGVQNPVRGRKAQKGRHGLQTRASGFFN
jgi:hypothetical protein